MIFEGHRNNITQLARLLLAWKKAGYPYLTVCLDTGYCKPATESDIHRNPDQPFCSVDSPQAWTFISESVSLGGCRYDIAC